MARPDKDIGLRQVFPLPGGADNSTIDIVAIHGLGTQSPRAWEFRKHGHRIVNWLADPDMLPAATPNARIFTYNWNANHFGDAPVETLLGHADTLLRHVTQRPGSKTRPLVFIASCFGGIILAQAFVRAAKAGNQYRRLLLATIGIIFLGTPFRGCDSAAQAQWQFVVGGIMREQASKELIDDLYAHDVLLSQLTVEFTRFSSSPSSRLPLFCFFESRRTKLSARFLPAQWAGSLSKMMPVSYKILVTKSSACLDGAPQQGLDATHADMNKFDGPNSPNFLLVKAAITRLVENAVAVLDRRRRTSSHARHWLVPFPRNRHFVGRKPMMDRLLKLVPPVADRKDCQHTVIRGLGGMGKTQVALEVAYRVQHQYPACSVFWVSAVDLDGFEKAYRDIGEKLQVPGIEKADADVKSLVKAAMSQESCGSWLLIVDGADDMKLFFNGTNALYNYLPVSQTGSILLTTRNNEIVARHGYTWRHSFRVEGMTEAEAIDMLRTHAREGQVDDDDDNDDNDSTKELLASLTYHPLAIKQAAAHMAESGLSVAQYLHDYRSADAGLLKLLSQQHEYHGRYPAMTNAIATTWLVSFHQLLLDAPMAADILRISCFFLDRDIPLSLFSSLGDKAECHEAVNTLHAYSFIMQREGRPESFDVHRLDQVLMRTWLQQTSQVDQWSGKAVQLLATALPSPEHETRVIWRQYLPHALFAASIGGRDGDLDTEAGMALLSFIAETYSLLGRYKEAESMLRRTLKLRRKALGEEHPDTLSSMASLADVLERQGKYKEAQPVFQRTVDLMKEAQGEAQPGTLRMMHRLAAVLQADRRWDDARLVYERTLDLRQKVLGTEHVDTLSTMHGLAVVLRGQERYEAAKRLGQQTLEARRRVLGPEHADTLRTMAHMGEVLHGQGRYEQARQMHEKTLELSVRALGREHPDTLTTMNSLAMVLDDQGRYGEAVRVYEHTLDLRQRVLGHDHPHTLTTRQNLEELLKLSSSGLMDWDGERDG